MHQSLRARATFLFIAILVLTSLLTLGLLLLGGTLHADPLGLAAAALAASTVLGSVLVFLAARFVTRPLRSLLASTAELARGNFAVEVAYGANDEVGQLARSFNAMAGELAALEGLRRDFIGNVSHELKTPLATIQAYAQLLLDPGLGEEVRRSYAQVIQEEAGRLSSLSSRLLRLSRLDTQGLSRDSATFSLDEQIRRVVLLLEPAWGPRSLEPDLDLEALAFHGDEDMLREVWINLVENAVKFSPPGGRLAITLKRRGAEVECTVADEGPGIPEGDGDRVFERFFMGDRSRSQGGSGLGLAIVRKIVDLQGGRVGFRNLSPRGCAFTVDLPLPEAEQCPV